MENNYNISPTQYCYYSIEIFDGINYFTKFVKCHIDEVHNTNLISICFGQKQFVNCSVQKISGYYIYPENLLPKNLDKNLLVKNGGNKGITNYLVPIELALPEQVICIKSSKIVLQSLYKDL